jgi:2-amino-4-hydroxy-6-hydroxymethyldihydropteridine diphosphokinase
MRAFLGLGSNLGDRRQFLTDAVKNLPNVVAVSPLYETEPVGVSDEQDSYLNCVVEISWEKTPEELLQMCQELEATAGRQRHSKWEPRTLDIDILMVDSIQMHTGVITIPHPRMFERRFVMQPLADLAPELVPQGWERNVIGAIRPVAPLEIPY